MYIGNYIMYTKHPNGLITYDSVKSVDGRRSSYIHNWYLEMLKSVKDMGFDIREIGDELPGYSNVVEAVRGSRTDVKNGKRIVRHVLLYWCEFNATAAWKKNGNH